MKRRRFFGFVAAAVAGLVAPGTAEPKRKGRLAEGGIISPPPPYLLVGDGMREHVIPLRKNCTIHVDGAHIAEALFKDCNFVAKNLRLHNCWKA